MHLSQNVFSHGFGEIMVPVVKNSSRITNITAAIMQDLGYIVDISKAAQFNYSSSGGGSGSGTSTPGMPTCSGVSLH